MSKLSLHSEATDHIHAANEGRERIAAQVRQMPKCLHAHSASLLSKKSPESEATACRKDGGNEIGPKSETLEDLRLLPGLLGLAKGS